MRCPGEKSPKEVEMAGPALVLRNLNKAITRPDRDPFVIFRNINLSVSDGEFVSIVGPSGCGKTTLLRVINGLMPHSGGEILIDGRSAQEVDNELLMGFVFQGASLLPWRTSLKNVVLGLEGRNHDSKEAERTAQKFLDLVGLSGFETHYPHELSGGMQQRVNLARALAVNPRILLMDEPFAALDAQTRNFMQLELLRIWRETKKTVIFVTHMIAEAILLSDRVIVFSHRPGSIRSEVNVPLPRPRTMEMKSDARFLELEQILWKQIEEEVNASGGFSLM
jgi:ABC-type nitrate/sulfonate/bicarbonate transport system ATPase subunit